MLYAITMSNCMSLSPFELFFHNLPLILYSTPYTAQYNLRSSSLRKDDGHVEGIGNVSFFIATPYATANVSMSLYGGSPVSSSHRTMP